MKSLANKWKPVLGPRVTEKAATERHIALLALGIARALRARKMPLAEAENELFNPDTYLQLKRQRIDRRLVELLAWGMELENVYKLGQAALMESFDAIERLASSVLADQHKRANKAHRRLILAERQVRSGKVTRVASLRRRTK
jgi:hypothetical protein